ncbi:MAG: PepSY domain-containing protein [Gammaproteobacteria bacterium]
MHSTRTRLTLLLCGICLLAASAVQARPPGEDRGARPERGYDAPRPVRDAGNDQRYAAPPRSAPRGMSLSEAVSEAERRTGGRVLTAAPREENGQLHYRVKVLTPDGRVQMLYIDAR